MVTKWFKKKPSPEKLPGTRQQRVFVGGQYDFMPTLREMARFVSEISSGDQKFVPIIPFDYEITETETIDYDLEMLRQCKYAIFDLSDLGAQLVELREAKQNQDRILSLIVYPTRERRNEPERGRRTVLSFGLPHFGYLTFDELKGIIWRFLTEAPTEKDYSPRIIHDPELDREIRRARVLLGKGRPEDAREVLEALLGQPRYERAMEPWLQLALVASRKSDDQFIERCFAEATKICGGDMDKEAELWYFRGIVEAHRPNWDGARENLTKAEERRPDDGRILQYLGYVLWEMKERELAIEKTAKALESRNIPDPVVAIHAMNNLAYFYGEEVEDGNRADRYLDEALDLTRYLPDYHRVFRRTSPSWLDTHGWILTLKARTEAQLPNKRDEASRLAKEALKVLGQARKLEAGNPFVEAHWDDALKLEKELKAGG